MYSNYQGGNYQQGFNPNETYDQQGPHKKKDLAAKQHVGTEEIREIVEKLNSNPFNENFTLVTFDELNSMELMELLNKIIAKLDESYQSQNLRKEEVAKAGERIQYFLGVMNYPFTVDTPTAERVAQGERKSIYPVIYYLVCNYDTLKKRAELARFLVPLNIPEEMLGDEEMKNLNQEYIDLKAEFQVYHTQLEAAQKDSLSPNEIKKEIMTLEQEREQLNTRINMFKNKNNSPEFKVLLEATNLLRREQEEEAKLSEKYRTQRGQLEWTDQQLLSSQQRLIDAKRSLSVDNTAEQMLQGLRSEVKKNRDLCNERLGLEIMEKRKKYEQVEQLLQEPPVSASEITRLENSIVNLRRAVQQLEDKLKTEVNPDEDKLAVYKQQANLVAKKKEKKMEEMKKTEDEKERIERKIRDKEQELEKTRGPGLQGKGSFEQFYQNLKEKTEKFKAKKEELKDIQREIYILNNTEHIIRKNKEEYERELRQRENERGIQGASNARAGLEQISEQTANVNQQKGKTLEEISKIVQVLSTEMKQKKEILKPKMNELKELRDQFKKIEEVYLRKKAQYDQTTAGIESENAGLESEVKKLRDEVYGDDTKIHKLKQQAYVVELMTQRLNDENDYIHGKKQFSSTFKSNREMLQAAIKQQESDIRDLKKQRENVKENYGPSVRQNGMLNDLKRILNLKIQVAKHGGMSRYEGRGEQSDGNVNRLVVRE